MNKFNPFEQTQREAPLYIFDLDGTLALNGHRNHLIDAEKLGRKPDRNDWLAFYLACDRDVPNWPVITTLLQAYYTGADVRIWSGRGIESRGKTLMWLHAYTKINLSVLERILTMRPEADSTPDTQLKRKWLNALHPNERKRLVAVYDGRDSVVKMWRDEGVACFQVAPGAF